MAEQRDNDLAGAAVLFDLDGTLVDTAEDLAASMNHAMQSAGLAPVAAESVRHLVGHGARRMLMRGYELSVDRTPDDQELDDALALFLEHYEANIAVHSRPFDGAVEMIEALRARGARMAICTNKREAMARLLMETLGFTKLFETIVGADTASAAKPDAAPVQLCLQRTNADRAAFIGDSDTDIKAASAAGLPCFVADFGYGPLTLQDQTAGIFSSYADLSPLLEESLRD
ncbi:HAD-IA family hydrolase [Hyphococcus flavus]|uniref:Phosphoglycolate phosphatase n=1 Tax=Hyphococcus flavus TaxID=1866326 RepID=A0AAE9ZAE5_9PROT|nr:HAD-IA family hydrolase [Hyphococcus flavus]WDI30031.1 HAD-IA family hydrolase [Hyphococcus flavus]